ncbi:GTP 3',8-cyclase [Streptomyces microflavus]
MHRLIASPYNGTFLIARPGSKGGMRIPRTLYEELASTAESSSPLPAWLLDHARTAWGLDLEGTVMRETVLVRPETRLGYGRATYEINKGCNFNCEHCYLAERKFEGLSWPDKVRLLHLLRDAGVLWLQFTGGEPLIDRDFTDAYTLAHRSGMLIEILTNGSRLHRPEIINLLRDLPPHKVTVSLYGATPDSFDTLTRKPGAFKLVEKGLIAAHEAGLALELALIITRHNAHELNAMHALAERYGAGRQEYSTISPTYTGTPEPLAAQAPGFLDKTSALTCGATTASSSSQRDKTFSTSSRHPAALRSAGRASRLWLRPRSCLRPARRCRRRRAPAVDRPVGHESRTKPAASRGCLRRGRSDSGMGRGAVRECRPERGERRGAPIPTTFDPGRAEQSRPRASRSFVQWRAPP